MKRKTFLASGLMLSIFYALALVAAIAMFAGSALLYFAAGSFASIENIISQVLGPLFELGALILLIASAVTLLLTILMLIAATRFIKYSRADADIFARKKGLLVFYFILVILATAGFSYLLVTDILTNGLFNQLTLINQVSFGVVAFIHLLSVLLLIIGFAKNRKHRAAVMPDSPVSENYDVEHPAIYTSDLEDAPTKPAPQVQETKTGLQEQPFVQPQKAESHRLVDEIGKLDAMRQSGQITQEQYVKLRQDLIKNFVK